MHRRIGAVLMALALVTSGVAIGFAGTVGAQSSGTGVEITEQTTGGVTVVVDEVTLAEGGFVTIHDSTVLDGGEAVLTSVRGTSAYLEAGTHQNVEIRLDSRLAEDDTLVAMAHRDTDDDRIYSFVSSGGAADGPYTADGEPVVDTAEVTTSATVSASDQPTDGSSVLVDRVELSEGGFVTVHDSSLLDGQVIDSVRGTSEYLPAGVHEDVRVELDDELDNEDTLIPMAHRDTNGNEAYDFVDSGGEADGPFLDGSDEAVVDTAEVTPTDEASVTMSDTPTSGYYVQVDTVFVPEGGFATVHDSTVLDGAVFDSIRGSSDYLEPGLHRDVGVHLEEPLEADDTLVPMAHRDTNDNGAYDFAETGGDEDGAYTTDDDDPVVDTAAATVAAEVSMSDVESDGNTVVIDRVDLSEGGFVTVHDASLFEGETLGSVRGTSDYLPAGHHHDVVVELDEPLTEPQQLVPMAHRDTNGNEAYDFVESGGDEDGPYDFDGGAVVDTAQASVSAQTTFEAQEDVGETVVVDSVTLHDGGFVTVHDSSLLEGAVLDSVRGTSEYLGPGTHENVEVEIDRVPGGEDTLIAMPHRDTNDNQGYDFLDGGEADGPYVAAGEAVVDAAQVRATPEATATISDQASNGETVVVDSAELSHGGFLTIHDGTLLDGEVLGSVRGTSDYLEPGAHEDVEITLDEPYDEDGAVIAMPHLDTNGNEAYDFVDTEGGEDGPYVADGEPVLDDASLTVEDMDDSEEMDDSEDTDETETPDGSDGDGSGFGVVVAVLAVLGAVLAARRLR